MRLVKILLCLAFYPSWSSTTTINENAAEVVDNAVKALEDGFKRTSNPFGDLDDLREKLSKLIGASSQISRLAQQKHEPGSEGYKALKDFQSRAAVIWDNMGTRNMERHENRLLQRGPRPFEEYDTIVTTAIKKMTLLTNKIVDPKMSDSEKDMDGYRLACRSGDLAPKPILEYMKLRLVTECEWEYTAESVKHIAEHRSTLKDIFRRFQVTNQPFPDPSLYLPKFKNIYGLWYGDNWIMDSDVFKKKFPTYEKAIDAFFDEFPFAKSDDSNKGHGCYLRELIKRSTFNYSHIDSFVKKLQNQLKGLAAAWPSNHNQIFQDQIKDVVKKRGYFDREMLKNVSDLTNSILKETGAPNYTYDMLIVKAPNKNFQFHFESLSNNSQYTSIQQFPLYVYPIYFGLDTVLVRRLLNNTKNVEKVTFEDLKANITYAMKDMYDTKYVHQVAEGLKNKLGSFATENGFQGFAIARKWEKYFFKSCSAIDDVQYSKDSFSSIYNFTYQNSGNWLQHCETFKFYFFL